MNLVKGFFLKRLNRFVVECSVDGKNTLAYLPNPGRLLEILLPNTPLYLHPARAGKKLPYTIYGAQKDKNIIMLHTHYTNHIVRRLIDEGLIEELQGYRVVKEEIRFGNSRLDFLLERRNKKLYLEVKSCTLFHKGIAMFPDAPTERGRRHLIELSKAQAAAVLFLIHCPDVQAFFPDFHTDLEFAQTLYSLRSSLKVLAVKVGWNEQMEVSTRAQKVKVGLDLLDKELQDSGVYAIVLRLDSARRIKTGSLGEILYPEGYYIYVGTAKKGLRKRINRHRAARKRLHWHIDYLRRHSSVLQGFAIRGPERSECELAEAIRRLSDWQIEGFGSTDCNCQGHLFAMADNPLQSKRFIDTILDFRVEGLLNKIKI